jgi:hypothetical protein
MSVSGMGWILHAGQKQESQSAHWRGAARNIQVGPKLTGLKTGVILYCLPCQNYFRMPAHEHLQGNLLGCGVVFWSAG